MTGSMLQVYERGKKKNWQGFKTGTTGLYWVHENVREQGKEFLL